MLGPGGPYSCGTTPAPSVGGPEVIVVDGAEEGKADVVAGVVVPPAAGRGRRGKGRHATSTSRTRDTRQQQRQAPPSQPCYPPAYETLLGGGSGEEEGVAVQAAFEAYTTVDFHPAVVVIHDEDEVLVPQPQQMVATAAVANDDNDAEVFPVSPAKRPSPIPDLSSLPPPPPFVAPVEDVPLGTAPAEEIELLPPPPPPARAVPLPAARLPPPRPASPSLELLPLHSLPTLVELGTVPPITAVMVMSAGELAAPSSPVEATDGKVTMTAPPTNETDALPDAPAALPAVLMTIAAPVEVEVSMPVAVEVAEEVTAVAEAVVKESVAEPVAGNVAMPEQAVATAAPEEVTAALAVFEEEAPPAIPLPYPCEWAGCGARFPTTKAFIQHVTDEHISRLPWSSRSSEERQTLVCGWRGCWNTQPFAYEQRMSEHVRCHTLEQPYMCPVKHCHARFTVRSNCLAHGRSKHAKTKSFHPVFIHNALEEGEVQALLQRLDEDGRSSSVSPSEGASGTESIGSGEAGTRTPMEVDRDPNYVPDRKKRGGGGGWDRSASLEAPYTKRKRAENKLCPPPILTTEGRLLHNIKEMLSVKDSVEVVSSWCSSLYCEVQQVSERYLQLAALLSKDHSTSPFTESVGHFTQSVGNLEAMCTQTLHFVEEDSLAKLRGCLDQEQSKSASRTNAISSAC